MIDGVVVKDLKVIPDERGWLMEMLRCDEAIFNKFGQVYASATYPNVVKGFHYHEKQHDNVVCICGMIKLVLFDDRKDSPTYCEINEYFIGVRKPRLVHIPPMVYHGWKCIENETAIVINTVSEPYHYQKPDEFRVDPHSAEEQIRKIGYSIPYNWARSDG